MLGQVDDLVLHVALAAEVGLRRVVGADDDAGVVAGERRTRQLLGVVQIEELRRARTARSTAVVATSALLICAAAMRKRAAAIGPARAEPLDRDVERRDLLADLERAERVQDERRARRPAARAATRAGSTARGSTARQLPTSSSAVPMASRTSIGGSSVLRDSPIVTSKLALSRILMMKPISNEASPRTCHGVGPFERAR